MSDFKLTFIRHLERRPAHDIIAFVLSSLRNRSESMLGTRKLHGS